jgi:hypothetical protein
MGEGLVGNVALGDPNSPNKGRNNIHVIKHFFVFLQDLLFMASAKSKIFSSKLYYLLLCWARIMLRGSCLQQKKLLLELFAQSRSSKT